MIRKLILTIFLILAFAVPGWATDYDYYVRPHVTDAGCTYGTCDGTNYDNAWEGFDGGDGTPVNWSTVDDGNGKLFVAGSHSEKMAVGAEGEDGTPIQIVSCTQANGASTDDAGIIDVNGGDTDAIIIYDKDYITIDGLTAKNGTASAIQSQINSHIIITHCTISNNQTNGDGIRYYISGTTDTTGLEVSDSTIENCDRDGIRMGIYGTGAGNTATITSASFTGNTISACLIGINTAFSDWVNQTARRVYGITIQDNAFTQTEHCAIVLLSASTAANLISENSIDEAGYGGAYATNAVQLSYCENLIVEKNLITDTDSYASGDGYGIIVDWKTDQTYLSDGVVVRYNRVSGSNGATVSAGIGVYAGTNSKVYYNLSYGNQVGFKLSQSYSTGTVFYNNVAYNNSVYNAGIIGGPASTWKNNIFHTSPYGFYVSDSGTEPTETHNSFYNHSSYNAWNATTSLEISLDGTDLTLDPQLIDSANGNFLLRPGSPCIDTGTDVGLTQDFNGKPVPIRKIPDIGAHEWVHSFQNFFRRIFRR